MITTETEASITKLLVKTFYSYVGSNKHVTRAVCLRYSGSSADEFYVVKGKRIRQASYNLGVI